MDAGKGTNKTIAKETCDNFTKMTDPIQLPIRDVFTSLNEICQAILESRLTIETTVEMKPTITIKNKIVIAP